MTAEVSVVVPTFKRPQLLDRCLAALIAQTFDPSAYEIVIADDAACKSTRRQVEDWRAGACKRDRQSNTCPCATRTVRPPRAMLGGGSLRGE